VLATLHLLESHVLVRVLSLFAVPPILSLELSLPRSLSPNTTLTLSLSRSPDPHCLSPVLSLPFPPPAFSRPLFLAFARYLPRSFLFCLPFSSPAHALTLYRSIPRAFFSVLSRSLSLALLQCVAVYCSVLQRVATCRGMLHCVTGRLPRIVS